jgi:glycosyltransferase involved in cell wall biosynthesis
MTEFAVLMAVYAGDELAQVRAAYHSATRAQLRPPDQVVIVQDGPVPDGIAAWLGQVGAEPGVTVVRLKHNAGLATALNVGLRHVTCPIVARCDADDICLPQRFAVQVPMIESGLDLVGSAIAEFGSDPNRPGRIRSVKTTQRDIERQARFECPFHHPSVVFRKQAVLDVGGYPVLKNMEDYLLWATLLMNGARVANTNQVLVHYRVGAGAYRRRGGAQLARSEARLQKTLRARGFTTGWQYLRNRIVRGPIYRRMPTPGRRLAYRLWQRVKTRVPHREGHGHP